MIVCANPKAQYLSYENEIKSSIERVLNGTQYILGVEVNNFEESFAEYIGSKHAVGVANGTDAIEISLRAMGIGHGDKVISVSHSAVATIAGIESTGASAVLVDLEADFYTLDADLLEQAYTDSVKAVVAVHIYGQASNIKAIQDFCKLKGIFFIEDVAQAHGSEVDNKKLGSIGDVGTFSCYPTKNLGAIGDGGVITTNNTELYEKIKMLREYGWKDRVSQIRGRNSRLDEIQAAILSVKLKYLDEDNHRRNKIADIYDQIKIDNFLTPIRRENCKHVFHLYVCKTSKRDKLINFLNKRNIFPGIHYPIPIHLQPAYEGKIELGSVMSVTENIADNIISLPMYPELPIKDAEKVRDSVVNFFDKL
ncbi:MAG: DegT/DnrJ/EryC1/StrS family aminotransferase [Gammaproteobacteria bacterium]